MTVNAIATGFGRASYQRHAYRPETMTKSAAAAMSTERRGCSRTAVANVADPRRVAAVPSDSHCGGCQLTLPKATVRMRLEAALAARRNSSGDEANDTRWIPAG